MIYSDGTTTYVHGVPITYASTNISLSKHSGGMHLARQGRVVNFAINGNFSSLPNGGYTSLGTIPTGFRPVWSDNFYRQQAGQNNYCGITIRIQSNGNVDAYNYTGAAWSGNGYFSGSYICAL